MKLGLTEMKICLTSVHRNENMSLETSNDHIQEKEQFAKKHKIKIEKEKHENLTLQRREKLLPSQ